MFAINSPPAYIATRRHDEDLSDPVVAAMSAALAAETAKPRSARIQLFETREAQDRLIADACRAVSKGNAPCPLRVTITPQGAATAPGAPWSKFFSEQEAIAERHLPTLIMLLTQDSARVTERDRVFALFVDLAETATDLAKVAVKPRLLDDAQFDAVIARILSVPGAGNEALGVLAAVTRLSPDQRAALRAKAFAEASVGNLVKHYGAGRLTDAELATLAPRMRAEFAAGSETAIVTLEAFGSRLPADLQSSAVDAIARGRAAQALAGLRHLDPASPLRRRLVGRLIAGASAKDLDGGLSHGRLEEMLTPAEVRSLTAHLVGKAGASKEWLDLAVRLVPVRAMTPIERKAILDELMFVSTKSAMEFVSEHRQYLDPADIGEVTRDYAKTVAKDFCLHLTHRNANRQTDYFSEAQMKIFKECAEAK